MVHVHVPVSLIALEFSWNIDAGQTLIAILISIIGWFVAKELKTFQSRLDKHDSMILKLVGDVQRLIGYQQAKNEAGE